MKYKGSCHCGEVQFECEFENPKELVSCNCSICSRKGWLLTFVPDASFKLVSGQNVLKDYQFGKKNVHHEFCSNCGTSCFSNGDHNDNKTWAVNTRCLHDFEYQKYQVNEFDGKKL